MKKYEQNLGANMFMPSPPPQNQALQTTEVPNMQYDNVKIEDMRGNELFDKSYSGLDKVAHLQRTQLSDLPKVKEVARQMQLLKDAQTGQGKKTFI